MSSTARKTHRIALLPGDGTGPEVIAEACKVTLAAAAAFGFEVEFTPYDLGAARYLRTGELLPDSVLNELRGYEAIGLGAIGHPEVPPGVLERGILLRIRRELDQYINLRPVHLYEGVESPLRNKTPADLDYTVIRENTAGAYCGEGGATPSAAFQTARYTRPQIERCLRFAFEYTLTHGKKARGIGPANTLTLVGKSNVLSPLFGLWLEVFAELGDRFPDVTRDYFHVDAAALYQIQSPEIFDVIVTTNLFGDILTDLGAATQGGLGVAAGANLNPHGVSMFEPVGGTAPLWTGKNAINPIAAIAAFAMMLDTLGETAAAAAMDHAIRLVVRTRMASQLAGRMGLTTSQVGDAVATAIAL